MQRVAGGEGFQLGEKMKLFPGLLDCQREAQSCWRIHC